MLKKNKIIRVVSAILRVTLSIYALSDMWMASVNSGGWISKPTNDDSYEQKKIQQCFDNNPKIECRPHSDSTVSSNFCETVPMSRGLFLLGLILIIIECFVALGTAFLSSNTGEATARYLIADGVLDIIIMIIASVIANDISAAQTLNSDFLECYPNQNDDDQFWVRVSRKVSESDVSSSYTIAVVVAITQAQEFVDKVAEFVSD